MRVKAQPIRRSGSKRRPRRRTVRSPVDGANPSGPPAPGGGASAKVYWPGGLTHDWCTEEPTWTTSDWANMLTPNLDGAALDCHTVRFVDRAEHYTEVVSPALAGLSLDDYVVLANDRADVHYADWVAAGLGPELCPWRANTQCWGVHGPVIVMPRSSYP